MTLSTCPRKELHHVIEELDQALYNHHDWHRLLIRSLVCKQPADKQDLEPNAHEHCRFGQWYYSQTKDHLTQHPGFIAVGKEHKHLHELTKKLLETNLTGTTISNVDYDNFMNSLERLQLEIASLKNEIEELLYHRDVLTGASNREDMFSTLRKQFEMVKRKIYDSSAVIMMDLDYFSRVNNVYGHPMGDKVLVAVVNCVNANLRAYDSIFRYFAQDKSS
ncbi:MAG: hypothetical protein CO120_09885 [Gammaproteobacteria bacterium CG_4_9_14_3_um_filter_38_9]|nr:MAG: hypothetical protein CO120_09885 [Gammaproteobacteria bacterium CG_4_9_14_3_um_filter_38_9]